MEEEVEGSLHRPRVRGDSIGSMSRLLLQGWTMLADSCQECGVPLMRQPGGTQVLCVNCGPDTASEAADGGAGGDAAASAGMRSQSAPAAHPVPNGTAASGDAASSSSDSDDEGLVEAPPPLRTRLRQAAGLAPVEHSSSIPSGTARQQLSTGSAAAASPVQHGSTAQGQGQEREDASKAIAELMLEGWAMLSDHCPRCLNPLLRSRDRRIYCAGCQMYAVREGEQERRQQQQPAAQPQAEPQPAPVAELGQAAAGAAAATATTQPMMHVCAASTDSSVPTLGQHVPAVDAAAAAVAERLAAATAAVRAAGTADVSRLLAELQQCAGTLQALADCRHSLASLQ